MDMKVFHSFLLIIPFSVIERKWTVERKVYYLVRLKIDSCVDRLMPDLKGRGNIDTFCWYWFNPVTPYFLSLHLRWKSNRGSLGVTLQKKQVPNYLRDVSYSYFCVWILYFLDVLPFPDLKCWSILSKRVVRDMIGRGSIKFSFFIWRYNKFGNIKTHRQ